jgi:O-antigen ligase
LLKNLLQFLRFNHISLAMVGLMWVFPFLHYSHQYPLTTFYQEWWSGFLGVLALSLLATRDYWRQPQVPRIAQLPVALIALILLQWNLGKIIYFNQALLYSLYLMFAALLMLLGARLREQFGLERLALVLAIFLLVGAELSALIGVLQHYRWHTPLDSVVVIKVSSSMFGNLAQPNHFANYTALGLVSLGLLYQQRKLKAGYVALLALPLLFVMTLSGSRSTWLYLMMMSGLGWWWWRRDAGQRALLRYSLLLIAGFGVMHLIVQLPFMGAADSSIDTVQRLFGNEASTSSIRLHLLRESLLIFMRSPWLGAGFGQFAWQHFQLQPVLFQSNVAGLYNNAHNLIFHLAAEAGMAGLLVLLAPLGVWLYGVRRAPLDAAHWWGYAALGVLAIHSLLEYPLWYTYFLAIAALLLGALDETRYRLELRNAGRVFVAAILLLGLVTLVQLRGGYRQMEQAWRASADFAADRAAFERTRDSLAAMHGESLLSPYVELLISSLIEISDEHLNEKLGLNNRVMHLMPIAAVTYRQALLLAQSGQMEQARAVMEQAIWSYPGDFAATRQQMAGLAEKDPARFSALLEFALQKEQEYQRAVHHH